MSTLFISHSSKDNERALFVRDWLADGGWKDVFLDLDPAAGLAPGQRWQEELRKAGERCAAVVVLVSPDWLASDWCRAEFLLAVQLGKRIFPVMVSPVSIEHLPVEMRATYQVVDISDPAIEADGLQRFRVGLGRAGLHPDDFPWPPPGDPARSPYRGLAPLDVCDAAVFFGRDAAITRGMDCLRRLRNGAPERLLVILGASGSGKSSFLRAGLLARLQRDEQFLVLPLVRPGLTPLGGSQGLLASLGLAQEPDADTLAARLAALRREMQQRPAMHAPANASGTPPTLVLAIDQAEELLDATPESAAAIALLTALVAADAHLLVIVSLRADRYASLQAHPALGPLPRLPFDLPPMPVGAFKEVIEAPGKLADPPVVIEPALSERLLNDLAERDALPLLAFALEWMLRSGRQRLGLADYENDLGGLGGAIGRAVSAALEAALQDPALPDTYTELEGLARHTFIPWLVRLEGSDGTPKRRAALVHQLPGQTRALVGHLVRQRLLVSGVSGRGDTVEVAHEAVLRQWPALMRWIDEERIALAALHAVQSAAREWLQRGGEGDRTPWLLHRGDRLGDAEQLAARPDMQGMLDVPARDYLAACRAEETRRREQAAAQAERERRHLARQRQQQRRIGAALALIALILVGFGGLLVAQIRAASEQVSLVLADYAQRALRDGNAVRAMRLAVLASRSDWLTAPVATARPTLAAAAQQSAMRLDLAGHRARVHRAAFAPDETRMASVSVDGEVRLWDLPRGKLLHTAVHGGQADEAGARFSPDGTRLVTWGNDGGLLIVNAADGAVVSRHPLGEPVYEVTFAATATRLVTRQPTRVTLWRVDEGSRVSAWEGRERVDSVFSSDGRYVLAWDAPGRIKVLSADDGKTLLEVEHPAKLLQAAFVRGADEFVVVDADGGVTVRESMTGAERSRATFDPAPPTFVEIADDGSRAVIRGLRDQRIFVWDADNAARMTRIDLERTVGRMRLSNDGSLLLTWGSFDPQVDLWRTDSGGRVATLLHDGGVNGALFSSDDARVLSWGKDGTARVWATESGETLARYGHGKPVWTAQFDPSESRVYSWDASGVIEAWGAPRGAPGRHTVRSGSGILVTQDRGHRVAESGFLMRHGQGASVFGLHLIDNGERAVSWGDRGIVRVWDTRGMERTWFLPEGYAGTDQAGNRPLALVWDTNGGLAVWNRDSGALDRGRDDVAYVFDARPVGSDIRVLSGSASDGAVQWMAASGLVERRMSLPIPVRQGWLTGSGVRFLAERREESGHSFAFLDGAGNELASRRFAAPVPPDMAQVSTDGRRGLLIGLDAQLVVLDLDAGQPLLSVRMDPPEFTRAWLSPDGAHVVTSNRSRTALWAVDDGARAPHWASPNPDLVDAQYVEDGRSLLLLSRNGTVELRSLTDGETRFSFAGDGEARHARLSPDGHQVLTWGDDSQESLRLWDSATGYLLATDPRARAVVDAGFDRDTRHVEAWSLARTEMRRLDFSWAMSARDGDLAERLCADRLTGTGDPVPAVRRINAGDAAFAPILSARVGEDVCGMR